jgi:chemotaxis protein MotB
MVRIESMRRLAAGFLVAAPLAAGCVSPHGYQQALEERDGEIRRLREERAMLKSEIQGMRATLDEAQARASEASAAPAAAAAEPAPAQRYPELDDLGIDVGMRDGNLVISIPSSITFASGQATLSKEGQKALKKVAATLKKDHGDARYRIEGHTDTDPIKKSKFESNRQLSVERAMAVLTYLVAECGIPDDQCIVAGHGQYDPIAGGDAKDAKAKNRRVEIVVVRR